MPKMHQTAFAGRALPGPAGELKTRPLRGPTYSNGTEKSRTLQICLP